MPAPGVYEWEEYATQDGFLYYNNPRTGETQWLKPFSKAIRTIAVRAREQAALAASVDQRVQAALQKSKRAAEAVAAAERTRLESQLPMPHQLNASASAPDTSSVSAEPVASKRQSVSAPLSPANLPASFQPRMPQPHAALRRGGGVSDSAASAAAAGLAAVLAAAEGTGSTSADAVQAMATAALRMMEEINNAAQSPPRQTGHTQGEMRRQGSPQSSAPIHVVRAQPGGPSGTRRIAAQPASHGPRQHQAQPKRQQPAASQLRYLAAQQDSIYGGSQLGSSGGRDRAQLLGEEEALHDGLDGGASVLSRHSLATTYRDMFEELPALMDERTQHIMARSFSFAPQRRVGYADARPDVRPRGIAAGTLLAPAPLGEGGEFTAATAPGGAANALTLSAPITKSGFAGKADAVFMSQLRSNLYTPKTDQEILALGNPLPSDAVVGYAYRHAAATSQYCNAGDVYDRLTDIRGYTGSHKHRFDQDGRGLGLAGRENSIDYKWLVNSIQVEPSKGAPVLPGAPLADLRDHSAGAGRK
jgi:hypothetical protein